MDNVLLIDLMNAIWRANIKFGSPKFINDKNEDFTLIYNFFRSFRALVGLFCPDKCFAVLEGHPQFRYDLFADYKANRLIKYADRKDEMTAIHKSKDEVIRLLQFLPITICRAANYEADDTISTLCENMRDESLTVISNDSDYTQLLQRGYANIQVYNPIKKIYVEAPEYPYVAWKACAGDKSDNIPALLKPKKAVNAVTNPEVFEEFMSTEENRSNFQRNRALIEFQPVPEDEIEIRQGITNFDALKEEFIRMEFESIVNDVSWHKFTSTFECLKY